MGFLQAVYSLGQMASDAYKDSPLADIINYLQLPYPLADPLAEEKKETVHAIRVWLDADDSSTDVLELKGIAKIDRIDYEAIGGDENREIKIKEHCLYRDPVGTHVSWLFTPLFKLGREVKTLIKIWQEKKGIGKATKIAGFISYIIIFLRIMRSQVFLLKVVPAELWQLWLPKLTKYLSFGQIIKFLVF